MTHLTDAAAFVSGVSVQISRRPRARVCGAHARPRPSPPTMIRGFPNRMPSESDDVPIAEPPQPKRAFDALIDFPCVFTFKVIGVREGEFLDDISDAVARVLKTERRHLKTSFRDKGKYRSITLSAPVNCAQQIYEVYAVIDQDKRVKFKF